MVTAAPPWVEWARRLQALAQTGLAYGEPTVYDRERYAQIREIAAEMLAASGGPTGDELRGLLGDEIGHATPKLDARAVVFRGDGVLLVQERQDGCWALPGGWVDVGESPAAAVERELREESGYSARAVKLLALHDRERHLPRGIWHVWNAFFLCELDGGDPGPLDENEILAAGFFPLDALPELAPRKTTRAHLERFFAHRDHPEWPTDFD
jgi:ADP-ribose pyrophosphatase YjhB (NUDIX family)